MHSDLLNGSLKKQFIKFLFPAIAGNLAYGILIFIDTVFIGRGIGSLGLAALNISIPIFTLGAFGVMLGIGGATVSAIDLGRGDNKNRNEIFTVTVISGVIIALLFTFLMTNYLDYTCKLLGATEETFLMVKEYVGVLAKTMLVYILPSILTNFIRNDNNPKLAMNYLVVVSIVNVILDYLFIFPMQMGMRGAAMATSIAQIAGTSLLLTHFFSKKNTLKLVPINLNFNIFKRILKNGISSFISEISMGIVIIFSNYQFFNYLGNDGVSAFSIVLNIKILVQLVLVAFGQAMQPILSINYGAKLYSRVREIFKISNLYLIISGVVMYLILISFSSSFIKLFNKDNYALLEITKFGFPIYFSSIVFMGINFQLGSFFQSMEYNKISALLNILRGIVFILIFLYILPYFYGILGLWSAYSFAELIPMLIGITYYKLKFKKHISNTP